MNLTTTIKITYLCGGMNKALVAVRAGYTWRLTGPFHTKV